MEFLKLVWSWQTFAAVVLGLYHKEIRQLLVRALKATKAKVAGVEFEISPDSIVTSKEQQDQKLEVIEGQAFTGGTVALDGKHFKRCSFENVELTYSGGLRVGLSDCSFSKVKWMFAGPAEGTLGFLSGLYHGAGEGGQRLVESTFESIRKGTIYAGKKE